MGSLTGDREAAADVIVAAATPPGVSAIAVVRLSGPSGKPLQILKTLAPKSNRPPQAWRATLCHLVDRHGNPLDEAIAIYLKAPRSPTGEDVVELSCHGSPAVVEALLDAARAAGARPARPGEFSRRAFLNGKSDLARLEGIANLTRAESRESARRAFDLANGALSRRTEGLGDRLLELLAEIEAGLDFAEDVDVLEVGSARERVGDLLSEMEAMAALGESGAGERTPTVAIVGRPNAGKSTLFNALVGHDRAIVAESPGTTRDAVSETIAVLEQKVRLVDSAGLRPTTDAVEGAGVAIAKRLATTADLVLYAVDSSERVSADDELFWTAMDPTRSLLVLTKTDLPPGLAAEEVGRLAWRGEGVRVSAETGQGVAELRTALGMRLRTAPIEGELMVLERHRDALARASQKLREATGLLSEPSWRPELIAVVFRQALEALGEITGETTTEELLDRVFAGFCVGK